MGDQTNYKVTVDFTKKTLKMGLGPIVKLQFVFGDCLAKECYEGFSGSSKFRFDIFTHGESTLTTMQGTPDNRADYECDYWPIKR